MYGFLLCLGIISQILSSPSIPGVHAQSSAAVEYCPAGSAEAVSLSSSCVWRSRDAQQQTLTISGDLSATQGNLPVVVVDGNNTLDAGQSFTAVPGFVVTLTRLVLANVSVLPPTTPGVPLLWPLGMFSAPAARMNMSDVRLVVSRDQFNSYLTYISTAHPAAVYHTDQESFLHIASSVGDSTSLQSVTLLTSPCSSQDTQASVRPTAHQQAAAQSRCAVITVSNVTLLPTLQQRASVSTQQPLLILITRNSSLGVGLQPGAVPIRRPVVLAGFFSQPTSIDLGMVTNQLNVTERYSKMYWQSLLLENVAPGDALSAVLAPPFSIPISANIWAVYCNRSQNCLNLHNTTTVVATELERDYITYMFSMFNSPLPSLRQTTDFYRTDLKTEYIQFVPGPGADAITVQRLKNLAWYWVENVITDKPQVARQLPIPAGVPVHIEQTQAGPLAQAVSDCSSLQAAVRYTRKNRISEARTVLWMLTGNVTLNPPDQPRCWQNGSITHRTQLFGQKLHSAPLLSGGLRKLQQDVGPSGDESAASRSNSETGEFALGFNYMPAALQLPAGANHRFFQFHNVTLHQLPQGPGSKGAAASQEADQVVDQDAWTILLWSIQRTMRGDPLWLSHVQLVVPTPEFDYLRAKAQAASSFAVPLTSGSTLLVTGAHVGDDVLSFSSLQGPGVSGTNIWISADPTAAAAMPGYAWPLSTSQATGAAGSRSGLSTAGRAAVGIGVTAGGLLALLMFGLLWQRKRHYKQLSAKAQTQPVTSYSISSHTVANGDSRGDSAARMPLTAVPGDAVLDVDQLLGHKDGLDNVRLPAASRSGAGQAESMARPSVVAYYGSLGDSNNCNLPQAPDQTTATVGTPVDTVQDGLQRWRAAINTTTLKFIERRMGSAVQQQGASGGGSQQSSSSKLPHPLTPVAAGSFGGGGGAVSPGCVKTARMSNVSTPTSAAAGSSMSVGNLQLQSLIGQGSFGSVYLGTWHGKRVAVKVMQLPAVALLGDSSSSSGAAGTAANLRQQRNSPPHMAIMETVVSSTMSHPNVVQVFTYMLNPLTVEKSVAAQGSDDSGSGGQQDLVRPGSVSGWELRLVMEYCDQGTLREALNRKTLLRGTRAPYLQPSIVLGLAHDVAAAMLHMHNEGVIHGDLKAANVLLTTGGEDPGNIWAATVGFKVTAKVADFGLALPLDPDDTHATMAARGTPTHMSPELFMSGHVSKASDVYAYGILLYEIITGQRAYAGVPIPLLPHEVARQGLRPTWPSNLSGGHRCLQQLAEACWSQRPQDRPSFLHIFSYLESCLHGTPATHLLSRQRSADSQTVSEALVSSPRSPVAEVVDLQLQELKNSAERQLCILQQQQKSDSKEGMVLPVAAAVVNRGEVAWSEVTCGGFKGGVEEQALQQLATEQQYTCANAPAIKTPKAREMGWSEVSYGRF